jgi:hypothetical protein
LSLRQERLTSLRSELSILARYISSCEENLLDLKQFNETIDESNGKDDGTILRKALVQELEAAREERHCVITKISGMENLIRPLHKDRVRWFCFVHTPLLTKQI